MNCNAVTVLEILSLTFTLAQAQFYFCLNGPQRIKSDDCDYGLVLAKQTGSQCVGAVKEQQDLGIIFNSSICYGDESSPDPLITSGNTPVVRQDTLFQVADLQSIGDSTSSFSLSMERMNPNGVLGRCLTNCLADWIDPATPVADDPPYDFGLTPPTPAQQSQEESMSKELLAYLTGTLDSGTIPNSKADMRVLDIFHQTLSILEKHCAPFLTSDFVDAIYAAHRFLVKHPYNTELNDIGVRDYAIISTSLKMCKDNPSKFLILSENCGDPDETHILSINGDRPKLEGKSFRWGLFDFLIEAAWSGLEFVHGYCYKEFMQNLNYQHLLVKVVGALFSSKIQARWMYASLGQSEQFWSNLLGVTDLNLTMRNIDACIVAGRKFSPYKDRLGRPFEKQPGTYQASSGSYPVESLSQRPTREKGFKGTLDEYWLQYEQIGGIKAAIGTNGFCAEDEAQFAAALRVASSNCPPEINAQYSDEAEEYDDSDLDYY